MIIVRVELWGARTGRRIELARMRIANLGGSESDLVADYVGHTFIGRHAAALDRGTVSRTSTVKDWRRQDHHVWNLVRRMLENMGYTK